MITHQRDKQKLHETAVELPEILLITAIRPREGVIATFAQDLLAQLDQTHKKSFCVSICAIEDSRGSHTYSNDIKYVLDAAHSRAFIRLAKVINLRTQIRLVVVQHEFEFFSGREDDLISFLTDLSIPVITVFHFIPPQPDPFLKLHVRQIAATSSSILVLNETKIRTLLNDYDIPADKINLLDHNTYPAGDTTAPQSHQQNMWVFCNKYLN